MAKTRFEWDYEAAGDLMLRSQAIVSVCESVAEKMTRAADVEYRADVYMGKTRVNAAARKKGLKRKKKSRTGEVKAHYRKDRNGNSIYVRAYTRKRRRWKQ